MSVSATSLPAAPAERHPANDSILIGRVCDGDPEAMEHLFDRHGTAVFSIAMRILHVCGAAEDVLQEVFLQIWREPDSFRDLGTGLAGSLVLLARHRSIDRLLNQATPEHTVPAVLLSVPKASLLVDCSTAGAQAKLALPALQQGALQAAFFEGKTLGVIAEELGQTTATVRTQIWIALKGVSRTSPGRPAASSFTEPGTRLDS